MNSSNDFDKILKRTGIGGVKSIEGHNIVKNRRMKFGLLFTMLLVITPATANHGCRRGEVAPKDLVPLENFVHGPDATPEETVANFIYVYAWYEPEDARQYCTYNYRNSDTFLRGNELAMLDGRRWSDFRDFTVENLTSNVNGNHAEGTLKSDPTVVYILTKDSGNWEIESRRMILDLFGDL